jgi:glycosyltransferase involved in cell wall biosynthesis
VCRNAAAIIALGEPVKRVVIEEKGVPEGRVSVIYPGIDLEEYKTPSTPVEIPGITAEHQVIMYVGSIVHPNQGVPILVGALPHVFETNPRARCVLVGGPAEAGQRYQTQLGRFGERLMIMSNQTPEQVVALTRRADVLVHPRLACRENYSVQSKIAVYLAAGRPIVATDFADYVPILGETGAGLLTPVAPRPLAEAILQVLGDPVLAGRLAAATGQVARELFSMERNVERYLDVYQKALAFRSARGREDRGRARTDALPRRSGALLGRSATLRFVLRRRTANDLKGSALTARSDAERRNERAHM